MDESFLARTARRMRDPAFQADQWARRYDAHIAPVNQLVDALRTDGRWLPYVAPMYGGTDARLLSVLRDPGPKTQDGSGSGFLSMENDDSTAALAGYCATTGIDAGDILPWNVYPWYINRAPSATELAAGVAPLVVLLALLPRLRVVMLHGTSAWMGWRRFVRRHPEVVTARGLHVIPTYHTSRQAFWHPDPAVRAARRERLDRGFAEAAAVLAS